MSEAVVHVDPTSPLTRVLQLMVSLKIRSFPVMNANGLEGIIYRHPISSSARASQRRRSSLPMHVPKHDCCTAGIFGCQICGRKLHSASGEGKCTTPTWCVILIIPR
jgi:hypothetical protein